MKTLNKNGIGEDGRREDAFTKSDASGKFLNDLNEEKCKKIKGKVVKEIFDQERIDNPRRRYLEIHFTDGSRIVVVGDYSILGWSDGSVSDRGKNNFKL